MLALGIRYLTGYAVATDVSDRGKPEWPPHPARVFMALAAAHFETGEDADERGALEWLQQQGPPAMRVSVADTRDVVTHYVPVNDSGDPVDGEKALPPMQSVALGRNRQPRTFPRVRPQDETVYIFWPNASPMEVPRAALARLCDKVIRVGHSSSLTQMWIVENSSELTPTLEPAETGEHHMRTVADGTLIYLKSAYSVDAIEAYTDLQGRIAASKGKAKTALKSELLDAFGGVEPGSLRPTINTWQPYRQVQGAAETPVASGAFDRELMVLSIEEGPVIGLESTWSLITALRDTILKTCHPSPEWITGHRSDKSPSQQPHLALLPLPFVGSQHADGHVLGIAMAFPKEIEPRDRGRALRRLLYDDRGMPGTIKLVRGAIGEWTLRRETRESPPRALQPESWTGPSDTWATVTPIVLDRHPKTDRAKDRERWSLEVAAIVAESCQRQDLPALVGIDIDRTCWHPGAPRAMPGPGGGFPLMPVKPGQSSRQQVHAWLRFDRPIEGPLLLAAGRYRGYGLCKPWTKGAR